MQHVQVKGNVFQMWCVIIKINCFDFSSIHIYVLLTNYISKFYCTSSDPMYGIKVMIKKTKRLRDISISSGSVYDNGHVIGEVDGGSLGEGVVLTVINYHTHVFCLMLKTNSSSEKCWLFYMSTKGFSRVSLPWWLKNFPYQEGRV